MNNDFSVVSENDNTDDNNNDIGNISDDESNNVEQITATKENKNDFC